MRIVFVCGSLEEGKDGVGDYTRRIAAELCSQGHQVAGISLNDNYLHEIVDSVQKINGIEFPVLRLPSFESAYIKKQSIKDWIAKINPEWLSLQFVPFAFHPKGLSSTLSGLLNYLGHGRKWHFMFHELWVGMDLQASKKEQLWGALQRHKIRRLLKIIRPSVIHTQTYLYQAYLKKLGFQAIYLPLFSNIPFKILGLNTHSSESQVDTTAIDFVVFGGIHRGTPIEQFTEQLVSHARNKNITIGLKIVGRFGHEHEHWASVWKSKGLKAEILGEKPAEEVSSILQAASIGICTTPVLLLEKSGSVAAMHEHGLPVVCLTRPWHPRGITVERPKGIFVYGDEPLENLFALKSTGKLSLAISDIARQFTANLLHTN